MKINFKPNSRSAYALLIVIVMALVSMIILGGTLNRTYGVARLNNRAVGLMNAQNAAEAAIERVFAQMQYDFQAKGGSGYVGQQYTNLIYSALVPKTNDDAYWGNFQFSDGQNNNNKTCVILLSNFTGPLPQAYSNRTTLNAPIYRLVSNAKVLNGSSGVTGTAQEDVMLALVPLTAYAIFYNGLLEFSTCATMVVNGSVHCNTNIFVGAGGSPSRLTFNTTVTASGSVTAPTNNGASWLTPNNYNSTNWRTYFNGQSNFISGLATVQLSIPMTNTHSLIEIPATNDSTTLSGKQELYNQAQVVVTVSGPLTNTVVMVKVQNAPTSADVPGADGSPSLNYYTNNFATTPSPAFLSNSLPFLSLTNHFFDTRENSTNNTTQIDLGKYKQWLTNAAGPVVGRYPVNGSSGYPTILFVADNRNTNGANKLDVVRITNGIAPPVNGGQGFSIATPNPLYVWGNYNETNASLLGTTNTTSGTVPCAFMSDALTILSSAWSDNNSLTTSFGSGGSWGAAATNTVNAAILTGIVPSTGIDSTHFSGGVHNLPRLLEDWSSSTLVLNTSIINLYNSTQAKGQFLNPGIYYKPPTRNFSYDNNFSNPTKVPPGMPDALLALRWNWATPPPNTVTYNVVP